jgi:glyoxylase-like metal-dependent hydrolase (beta-lactamase superfamily II)
MMSCQDSTSSPVTEWFHVRPVADGVWLLAEPGHVNSWLIVGDQRAAVIDTGLGIASIRAVAQRLTSVPLVVINTHHHVDHIGGNHEFSEIAIHEAGAEPLAAHALPAELLRDYMRHARELLAARDAFERLDDMYFHLLTADSRPRAFPPQFDPAQWSPQPSRATRLLRDGDRIDLGDRSLSVIHTPGHSVDGICLYEERSGLLFAGDTVSTGPIYLQFPECDLAAFAASVERLRALERDVRAVLVSHWGQAVADPVLLSETADGCARVLAGDVTLVRAKDLHGGPVQAAHFDRFSLLLAAG